MRYAKYETLEADVGRWLAEGRTVEAIETIERELDRFPQHRYDMLMALWYLRFSIQDHSGGMDVLERALEDGIWYGIDPSLPMYASLDADARFAKIVARSNELRRQASVGLEPVCEVVEPVLFDKTKAYPLLLVLHGWGGDIDEMRPHWSSSLLVKDFIVAFAQSAQLVKMNGGYGWSDLDRSRVEINTCLEQTLGRYDIDRERVIIAGFSQGAATAIWAAVRGVAPAAGFLAACPGWGATPGDTRSVLEDLAPPPGLRGAIITGAQDPDIDDQRKVAAALEKAGVPCSLAVNEGLGHWYPQDFGAQVNRGIHEILEP